MAVNRQHKVSLEGELNVDDMTVFHETKEGYDLYDFEAILNEFHGKNVSISITEKMDLPTKQDDGDDGEEDE